MTYREEVKKSFVSSCESFIYESRSIVYKLRELNALIQDVLTIVPHFVVRRRKKRVGGYVYDYLEVDVDGDFFYFHVNDRENVKIIDKAYFLRRILRRISKLIDELEGVKFGAP